jgi:hypothetical protein
MSLREKQVYFIWCLADLFLYAKFKGYEFTFQPEHENHMENSLHYIGLAKDLNLFKDKKYLKKTEDHKVFGLFWESMGCTWGGRFNDGNHYSIEHEGRK